MSDTIVIENILRQVLEVEGKTIRVEVPSVHVVTVGVQGPQGAAGAAGGAGAAGPNLVNGSTATTLSGYLKGNGSIVSAQVTPIPVVDGGTGTTSPSLVAGTNVTITGTWPNQTISSSGGGGGGGSPAGSNTQIQYNNAGAFAGSADLTWDNSTKKLATNGIITATKTGAGGATQNAFAVFPTGATRNDAGFTIGHTFFVADYLTVSDLGRLYEPGSTQDHAIGIWVKSTGTLVTSGTILAASSSDANNFKYVAVTPVVLNPGVEYIIAAQENAGGDLWKTFWFSTDYFNGHIRRTGAAYVSSSSLTLPNTFTGGDAIYNACTFKFTTQSTTQVVASYDASHFLGIEARADGTGTMLLANADKAVSIFSPLSLGGSSVPSGASLGMSGGFRVQGAYGGHFVTSQGDSIYFGTNGLLSLTGVCGRGGYLLVESTSDVLLNYDNPTRNVSISGIGFGKFNIFNDSASKVCATIRAATSQTANLTEWQDNSGTVLASVSSSGSVYSLGAVNNFSFVSENSGASSAGTWRFGKSWSGNYDDAFLFAYNNNNAKVLIDTAGALTAFGGFYLNVAASSINYLRPLQHGNSYVGFEAPSSGIPGNNILIAGWDSVRIDATTGSIKFQTGSTDKAILTNSGLFGIGVASPSAQFQVHASSASTVGAAIRAATSQTANLQEWQFSTGYVLAAIGADGTYYGTGNDLKVGGHSNALYGSWCRYSDYGVRAYGMDVPYPSSDLVLVANTRESLRINQSGAVSINNFTASSIGLTLKAAASQTANIQEWQNSSGAALAYISSAGKIVTGDYVSATAVQAGQWDTAAATSPYVDLTASLFRITNRTATQSFIIKGASSQTASLTEWQDNSGTVQLAIAANGRDLVLDTTTGTKIGTSTTQKLGFWNATPVVQSTGWGATNVTTDKSFDANATTLDELADVVGTLIEQLKTYGLLGA